MNHLDPPARGRVDTLARETQGIDRGDVLRDIGAKIAVAVVNDTDAALQLFEIGVLADIAGATRLQELLGKRAADIHGQADDTALRASRQQPAGRLETADPRHVEIHQNDGEFGLLGQRTRLLTARCFGGDVEVGNGVELRGHTFSDQALVVYY